MDNFEVSWFDEAKKAHAEAETLLTALKDVELRTTQARIASSIGNKKNRTDFLLGELERIAEVARAAIVKSKSV